MNKRPSETQPTNMTDQGLDVLNSREQRIQIERLAVEEAVVVSDFSTLRNRVAYILNKYPSTRNSDVTLQLKYWDEFEPDVAKELTPANLYKGTRLTSLARARAKIQNEYGLFLPKDHVRYSRRQQEDWMKEAILADEPGRGLISVYSDESGKNQRWNIIGGAWNGDGHEAWRLKGATVQWLKNRNSPTEFHFNKVNRQYFQTYVDYWDWVLAEFPSMGFKAIIVDSTKLHRAVQEVFHQLYPKYIVHGLRHEWDTARVDRSQYCSVQVIIDEEDRTKDAFVRDNIRDAIRDEVKAADLMDKVSISRIAPERSSQEPGLQLADLFAGTINRCLNVDSDGTHIKDELARHIRESLGIEFREGWLIPSGDRVVIEYL